MSYVPQHIDPWTDRDPAGLDAGNYAGERYPDYYVAGFRHRDSDVMTECNFDVTWKALEPLNTGDTVITIRTGHWAVGWTETILVHESNEAALRAADDIAARLESYPVLDDDALSEREQEAANQIWRDCYDWRERIDYIRNAGSGQFEFHDYRDMLACVRGEYFAGYASELVYR